MTQSADCNAPLYKIHKSLFRILLKIKAITVWALHQITSGKNSTLGATVIRTSETKAPRAVTSNFLASERMLCDATVRENDVIMTHIPDMELPVGENAESATYEQKMKHELFLRFLGFTRMSARGCKILTIYSSGP